MDKSLELFELAHTLSLIDTMKAQNVRFKAKNFFCPFHDNTKTPSGGVSISNGVELFKCFSCDSAGDIVSFYAKTFSLSNIEAVKKLLNDNNMGSYVVANPSDEMLEQRKIDLALALVKKQTLIDKETKKQKLALKEVGIIGKQLAHNFDAKKATQEEKLAKILVSHIKDNFDYTKYIGYDPSHKSIALLYRDSKDNITNIKWERHNNFDSKWIGFADIKMNQIFPSPLASKHIVLCEGEKDTLNLNIMGVPAICFGACTISIPEEHLNYFKNKYVYICFDNDKAGYIGAIRRYFELCQVATKVLIFSFRHLDPLTPANFDMSDFVEKHLSQFSVDKPMSFFYDHIIYACVCASTEFIKFIEDSFETDLKQLLALVPKEKAKQDIFTKILQKDSNNEHIYVDTSKGELDDKLLDKVMRLSSETKKDNMFEQFQKFIQSSNLLEKELKLAPNFAVKLTKILDIKRALLNNYRQTHLADVVTSFLKTIKASKTYLIHADGLSLRFYDGKYYQKIEDDALLEFLINRFFIATRVDYKKHTALFSTQVLANLKMKCYKDVQEKNKGKRVISFNNGTLIVHKNNKIVFKKTHDKNDLCLNHLDFDYNTNATCFKFKKFLNRVLPNQDDQKTLLEFFGYCFLPNHNYEAFLFLYGSQGADGKSVIIDTISMFFGEENISSLGIEEFVGHQLQALKEKLINTGSEVSGVNLKDGQPQKLKALTSTGDNIQINPKNNDPYLLKSADQPKLVFAGNSYPTGLDNAVLRRMLLLTFDNPITDKEKIRDLVSRFKDERAGIFALVIKHLQELIKNNNFTKSSKMIQSLNAYKEDSEPLIIFTQETIVQNTDGKICTKSLYKQYEIWCEQTGHKILSNNRFFTRLTTASTYPIEKKRLRTKELNGYYIFGISYTPEISQAISEAIIGKSDK